MNMLITGGLGFIGHNVVARLQRDHELAIIDNQTTYGVIPRLELEYLVNERHAKIHRHPFYNVSIEHVETLDNIFSAVKPHTLIHMASFPRQKVVNADPVRGADIMMRGLINLLERSVRYGCSRFVYISSSMVYGDFTGEVTEDHICKPQGQYGIMKLAGEWLVKDYSRRHGFEHVIVRPSAVYGPLDVEDRVVSKFMLNARRDAVLRVNGAHETLDFTYVDDAADGIVAASLVPSAANKIYNITKSHSWTLLDAANLAVKIVGKGRVEVQDKDQDYPSRGALNIDAARRDLGYDPKIDVEQGFQNYHTWLENSVYWSAKTV